MQAVYLHTQFGVMMPKFRIDDDNNMNIIINNNNIIRLDFVLSDLITEYDNNQKLLDLHHESFEIDIYEGVQPRIIIYINNQRFDDTILLQEMTIEYNMYA